MPVQDAFCPRRPTPRLGALRGTPFPAALLRPELHSDSRLDWPAGPAWQPRLCLWEFAASGGQAACGVGTAHRGWAGAPLSCPALPHLFSFSGCLPRACVLGGSWCCRGGRGDRDAGAPMPLICPLLLLGPGRCSHRWAQHHPGRQTRGRGPGAASVSQPLQFIFSPSAPSRILLCFLGGRRGRRGPWGPPSSARRAPPPWDARKPGAPRSQADLPGREPDGTPKPSPSTSKLRPGPWAGAEAACTCAPAGRSIQRREAGRSEGPRGQPGRAAAPKEQAGAGVAATLAI